MAKLCSVVVGIIRMFEDIFGREIVSFDFSVCTLHVLSSRAELCSIENLR